MTDEELIELIKQKVKNSATELNIFLDEKNILPSTSSVIKSG